MRSLDEKSLRSFVQRTAETDVFKCMFEVLSVSVCFHQQGDMGEDGPKGEMGEKVREAGLASQIGWNWLRERQAGLAVAGKHKSES